MSNTIIIILSGIAIVTIGIISITGLNKMEQKECVNWIEQAHTFDGYYLLDWQYEQCEAVGKPLPSGFLRAE